MQACALAPIRRPSAPNDVRDRPTRSAGVIPSAPPIGLSRVGVQPGRRRVTRGATRAAARDRAARRAAVRGGSPCHRLRSAAGRSSTRASGGWRFGLHTRVRATLGQSCAAVVHLFRSPPGGRGSDRDGAGGAHALTLCRAPQARSLPPFWPMCSTPDGSRHHEGRCSRCSVARTIPTQRFRRRSAMCARPAGRRP